MGIPRRALTHLERMVILYSNEWLESAELIFDDGVVIVVATVVVILGLYKYLLAQLAHPT